MRPRRIRAMRRPLDEESAEPAIGGTVCASGHMHFQLACPTQYGLFVSFVQRRHAEIRNTTYEKFGFTTNPSDNSMRRTVCLSFVISQYSLQK